jgi:hypothetical protein
MFVACESRRDVDDNLSISLRAFDHQVEAAYARLFPGDPDKTPPKLSWRFRDNPHGQAKFAIALHRGLAAGMIGLVPTRLVGSCGERLAYQAIDAVVHPDWRGQGLFLSLGRAAQEPNGLGGDILWGFPNASAAPGWFGRLGWADHGSAPLLMRPLRSAFVLGRIHRFLSRIDFALLRTSNTDGPGSESGQQLCADFEQLWRRIALDHGVAVERGSAWMRWRLIDKPDRPYRLVGERSDRGEIDTFVASKVVEKHGARLCYVMEALSAPDRVGDLAKLIRREIARAAHDGAEAALAWCPKRAPNYAAYRQAGFLPVPAGLRPIEINFGAKALREEAASAAAATADWYVSFLDSDTN